MAKAQKDYTVSDIIRLKPEWWVSKQSDEETAAEHLKTLATRIDYGLHQLNTAPIQEVFGTFDIGALDQAAINKAIFEYANKVQEEKAAISKKVGTQLFNLVHANLDTFTKNPYALESSKLSLEYELKTADEEISYAQRKINEYVEHLVRNEERYREKLDGIKIIEEAIRNFTRGLDSAKMKTLKRIPSNYVVIETTSRSFKVLRTEEVILNDTNAAAGKNRTLNMGYMMFEFSWNLSFIGAYIAANGITGVGYIHPHIASGSICWGNLLSMVDRAKTHHEVERFFKLFDALLGTYNSGSPYRRFDQFKRNQNTNRVVINTTLACRYPEMYQRLYQIIDDGVFRPAYAKFLKTWRKDTGEYRRASPYMPLSTKTMRYLGVRSMPTLNTKEVFNG